MTGDGRSFGPSESTWSGLPAAADIVAAVKEAGVIGAGGAGFPTYAKYVPGVEVVIANAAECEPLLEKDQRIVEREAALVVHGLAAAVAGTGAKRGVIAIKGKHRAAVEALRSVIGESPGPGTAPDDASAIEIFLLGDFYPAGDEQVLVYEVTGRQVPPGGLPLDVGAVVNNAETLLNVARALEGAPVTRKALTVAGAVSRPVTLRVPVGTPAGEVIAFAGPIPSRYAVIEGGPVMGKPLADLNRPVTKKTSGYIVLPEDHPLARDHARTLESTFHLARTACEQCLACTEACPRHLLGHPLQPHLIMRAAGYSWSEALAASHGGATLQALICPECRVCDYSCPVALTPSRVNAALKNRLGSRGIRYPKGVAPSRVHPVRDGRKVPVGRIKGWLDVARYAAPAPWTDETFSPRRVVIPLHQHTGAPAEPVVSEGATVIEGQLIGRIPEGRLGADIHAGISGLVKEVTPTHIVIEAGGVA